MSATSPPNCTARNLRLTYGVELGFTELGCLVTPLNEAASAVRAAKSCLFLPDGAERQQSRQDGAAADVPPSALLCHAVSCGQHRLQGIPCANASQLMLTDRLPFSRSNKVKKVKTPGGHRRLRSCVCLLSDLGLL